MDNTTRKKLKNVLIAFVILIIPIGYLFAVAYAFKVHMETMDDLIFTENKEEIKNGLEELDRVLKIVPWSTAIKNSKHELYIKLGEYRIVLHRALKTGSFGQAALMYEFLDKPDSAKFYYSKIITEGKFEHAIIHEEEILNQYALKRYTALLYTFLGDSTKAQVYLDELPNTLTDFQKLYLLGYDFYIDTYKSGGIMDFIHGERVTMVNDTLSSTYNVDSLLIANRITYGSKFSSGDKTECEFRLCYKEKAEKIGFNEIKE
jgi:tetratricopeptide (TPR) repeat protein